MELISFTRYYLAASLPEVQLLHYYCVGHQKSDGWTQDHADWIYVYQEVCPEDSRHRGMFQPCCIPVHGSHRHWMKTVTSSARHTHDPDDTAASATKLRTTLTQLYIDITANAAKEIRAELGNPDYQAVTAS